MNVSTTSTTSTTSTAGWRQRCINHDSRPVINEREINQSCRFLMASKLLPYSLFHIYQSVIYHIPQIHQLSSFNSIQFNSNWNNSLNNSAVFELKIENLEKFLFINLSKKSNLLSIVVKFTKKIQNLGFSQNNSAVFFTQKWKNLTWKSKIWRHFCFSIFNLSKNSNL